MAKTDLTAQRLRDVLEYSIVSGRFYWRIKPNRKIVVGARAGVPHPRGTETIGIDGTRYLAHRLVWLYIMGEWPADLIDHINTVPDHNGWHNLRHATKVLNAENIRVASTSKKSGLPLGVSIDRRDGAFRANIASRGRYYSLGRFSDPSTAHAAYLEAKRRLHAGCTI